ncbi:MAG: T9SS type A sorting domain-containing protein [Candidatus Cloacimonetes bacterium]|nr:T9SS type A sorting domain-containing protein [Candidatus Cloacimonadota bacterium]
MYKIITNRNLKSKTLILFTFSFLFFNILWAQDTWIIDLPYQDLYPEYFSYPDSYNMNVIPAIGGGYLATAFVNPGDGPVYWREMLFWKVNSQGEIEWRKQDTEAYEDTNFTSMVSNGVDRYYAISYHVQLTDWTTLYILDENCDVISTHDYWVEDLLDIQMLTMKILDDGLIIAGGENGGAAIMKTDLEGNVIWYTNYLDLHPNNPHVPRFRAVIPTNDNGFLACGYGDGNGYLMKFNAEGDTLWTATRDTSQFHNMIEHDNSYYITSMVYPGYEHFIQYSVSGDYCTQYQLLTAFGSQYSKSSIKYNGSEFILLYNSEEGEIHKVTPSGDVLWSYDYFIYSDDLIGSGADNLLIDDAGYYVYNATIDEWTNYPDFKLVRTDPEGIVPVEDHTVIPVSKIILTNYPNPFNPSTKITYSVKADNSLVSLSIFNLKGQKITTLVDEKKNSGQHSVTWNVEDLTSGIYLIKFTNNKSSVSSKCILIK